MAKMMVSATLLSEKLFHNCDKCPVIYGASWDNDNECVVLDIGGDGVPETNEVITVTFSRRVPVLVSFIKPRNEFTSTNCQVCHYWPCKCPKG